MQGLIGKKLGMTEVFDDKGQRVPVTVIQAGPCVVIQRKSKDKDGYEAVQLGFGDQKESRVTKATLGRCKKVAATPKRHYAEFTMEPGDEVKEGDTVTTAIFEGTAFVDVIGMCKGAGFQGVVKRHGMRGGPLTHGGHSKRRIGSVGQNAYPARIIKGKRMPGHMASVRVTTQSLRLVSNLKDDSVLLVCGAVPGPTGGIVLVRQAVKKTGKGS